MSPRRGRGRVRAAKTDTLRMATRDIFNVFLIFSDFFGRQESVVRGQGVRGCPILNEPNCNLRIGSRLQSDLPPRN
jgi:hypothetical protein